MSSTVTPQFSWMTRVYWEDTGADGVVYHARYVAFIERARTEWMRTMGYGQERMRQEYDLVFAVRAMRLDFLRPAYLDDALEVSVALIRCKHASLLWAQSIRRDGELLLEAEVQLAALSAKRSRPRAINRALYDRLKSLELS
ncbi:tol-pal system-associated acyl-CoA thioesterase [Xylella fastidiosa subsp. multiplex]|uniref:tol-pal system-associated acyl-CoA thioesterase n=1 Tax=Xylella fastidiosa TaxID=2371 RepID=UPI00235F8071|nr:tol-pal system-associated acyl-CoA thioesterase [Xylella fastidiosa]MDD0927633.1 tol-pal system-associated acyl-CoA thioesterase [Xylella fastidiosa subsp. multiplex]